jgi:hypothetical protein
MDDSPERPCCACNGTHCEKGCRISGYADPLPADDDAASDDSSEQPQ